MLRELDFRKNNVLGAERGDVIFYDWDNGADGFADHAMLVTDFSKGSNSSFRYPLFTGHSVRVDLEWLQGRLDRGEAERDQEGWFLKPRKSVLAVHHLLSEVIRVAKVPRSTTAGAPFSVGCNIEG